MTLPKSEQTTEYKRWAAGEIASLSLDLRPRLERAIFEALLGDAFLAIELARKVAAEIEEVAVKRLKEHALG